MQHPCQEMQTDQRWMPNIVSEGLGGGEKVWKAEQKKKKKVQEPTLITAVWLRQYQCDMIQLQFEDKLRN